MGTDDTARLRKMEALLNALLLAVHRGEARVPSYLLGQMKSLACHDGPGPGLPVLRPPKRSGSSSRPNTPRRVENLYQAGVLKMEERHREHPTTKEQEELQHCTFSPNIDRHSRRSVAMERAPFWDRMGGKSGSDQLSDRYDQLSKKSERLTLKGCTYQPVITRKAKARDRTSPSPAVFERLSIPFERNEPTQDEEAAATKIQAIARGRITRARVESAIERLHSEAAAREVKREQRFQELYSYSFQPDLTNFDAVLGNTSSHNTSSGSLSRIPRSPSPSVKASSSVGSDRGTPSRKITRSASRSSAGSYRPRHDSPVPKGRPPSLRSRAAPASAGGSGKTTPRKASNSPTPKTISAKPKKDQPEPVAAARPPPSPQRKHERHPEEHTAAAAAAEAQEEEQDHAAAQAAEEEKVRAAQQERDAREERAAAEREREAEAQKQREAAQAAEATRAEEKERAAESRRRAADDAQRAAMQDLCDIEEEEREQAFQEAFATSMDLALNTCLVGETLGRIVPATEEEEGRSTFEKEKASDMERIKRQQELARALRLEEEREERRAAEEQRVREAQAEEEERKRREQERQQKLQEAEQKERERRAALRKEQQEQREAGRASTTAKGEEDQNSDDEILRIMRTSYQAAVDTESQLEEVEDEETAARRAIVNEQSTLKRDIKKAEIQERQQAARARPSTPVAAAEGGAVEREATAGTPAVVDTATAMYEKVQQGAGSALVTQSHVAQHIAANEGEYRVVFQHQEQWSAFIGLWGDGETEVQLAEFKKIWKAAETMPVVQDAPPSPASNLRPPRHADPNSPSRDPSPHRRESRSSLSPGLGGRRRSSRSPSPSAHLTREVVISRIRQIYIDTENKSERAVQLIMEEYHDSEHDLYDMLCRRHKLSFED